MCDRSGISDPSRRASRIRSVRRCRAVRGRAGWIALGLILSAASVGAVYLLLPRPPEEAPAPMAAAPEAETPPAAPDATPTQTAEATSTPNPAAEATSTPMPAAEAVPAPEAADADPDPALAGVASVRLRVGPDFPPERREAIVAALEAAEIRTVQVEVLDIEIGSSRVGYYLEGDTAAAEALARLVAPVAESGGNLAVRNYGKLLPDAEPGRLDLWLGG